MKVKTKELEKGLKNILKREKCKFRRVTVDTISKAPEGIVLEYVVRVENDNYSEIRAALLKHHPTMTVETEFKFVRGILVV